MQSTLRLPLIFCALIGLSFFYACDGGDPISPQDPCIGEVKKTAKFGTFEVWNDTLFRTDTLYTNRFVVFKALEEYDEVSWQVGTDTRTFDQETFQLYFFDDESNKDIYLGFKGIDHSPDTTCFPEDDGIYEGESLFRLVEKDARTGVHTVSPLVGHYQVAPVDDPLDTFTVRLEFFDSAKYNSSYTGSKNFYYFSNFPNGYIDSTSDKQAAYPELAYGKTAAMGYRSFNSSVPPTGLELVGWLGENRDSLYLREDLGFWSGIPNDPLPERRYYQGIRVK